MDQTYHNLIREAKRLMTTSRDETHDLAHAGRVVAYTEAISKQISLTSTEQDALVLAAWWHDVARTITKKPSIVWMACIDDTVSAIMLAYAKHKQTRPLPAATLAMKLIICKSLGTGGFFTKLLLPPRQRHLVNIIKDADLLDVLHQTRVTKAMELAEQSRIYRLAYKRAVRWFLIDTKLSVQTKEALRYLETILQTFLHWLEDATIYLWHVEQFGKAWAEEMLKRGYELLKKIQYDNALAAVVA